jgi:sensor histidine kinase YesM
MLSEELATVRAYLSIEKERFRDKLLISYDIDEAVKISIPLLTIQPLVENALRHGIFKKPGGGSVEISVKNLRDFVVIKVKDDGVGIPEATLSEILEKGMGSSGVGLKNINKRLILHYGQGLELESKEGCGTSVIIRIPRIPGGESNANCNNS